MSAAPTTRDPGTPTRGSRASRWARHHLFRTPLDTILTLVFGAVTLYVVFWALRFVFVTGRWEIIRVNLKLLMVGRWPADDLMAISIALAVIGLWGGVIAGLIVARQIAAGTATITGMSRGQRAADAVRRFGLLLATLLLLLLITTSAGPWLTALAVLAAAVAGYAIGRLFGIRVSSKLVKRLGALVLVATPVAVFFYLAGVVPLAEWEGFMFNLVAAAAGIALSFPLGVLLALGRRSKLRLLQWVSITYIEFVRGSPLYVLLLLANVSLEFFVPASIAPSKVIRAIVTFMIFTAAYLAEIVRGGLQSVPRGQEEAAKSLGLTPTRQMFLIVLPQALRNVIPAQIGQFISLFKDTTLAGAALGILDLLDASKAITQQEAFRGQGLIIETLLFVGFMFWVGAFTMSRESQRLERKLGVGTR